MHIGIADYIIFAADAFLAFVNNEIFFAHIGQAVNHALPDMDRLERDGDQKIIVTDSRQPS